MKVWIDVQLTGEVSEREIAHLLVNECDLIEEQMYDSETSYCAAIRELAHRKAHSGEDSEVIESVYRRDDEVSV